MNKYLTYFLKKYSNDNIAETLLSYNYDVLSRITGFFNYDETRILIKSISDKEQRITVLNHFLGVYNYYENNGCYDDNPDWYSNILTEIETGMLDVTDDALPESVNDHKFEILCDTLFQQRNIFIEYADKLKNVLEAFNLHDLKSRENYKNIKFAIRDFHDLSAKNDEQCDKVQRLEKENDYLNRQLSLQPNRQDSFSNYLTYENIITEIAKTKNENKRSDLIDFFRIILPKNLSNTFIADIESKCNSGTKGASTVYVTGDYVQNKHVENEVNDVQNGGTGINVRKR